MNTKLEEKIYKTGQKVTLTFDEREAMRARLLSSIAVSERKILSPYSPMFYWRYVSTYVKPQYVSIALLFILVIGGVSAAAEKSLPGEPLYQVKSSVNENLLALFALTPQSKAQLNTDLAVRRLEEVETLAISGKLDASTTAEAETKIDGNLAVIKDSVQKLESENNATTAADTSSQAEDTLKVHRAILDTLADGNANVQNLATQVGIQATALSLDRAGIDSRNSSTTLSIDVLLDQEKVAQDAIDFMQDALATSTATSTAVAPAPVAFKMAGAKIVATSTATTTSVDRAQAGLQSATDFLSQGSDKLNMKKYGDAFVLFKKAEKAASDAKTIFETGDLPSASISSSTSATTTGSTASSTIMIKKHKLPAVSGVVNVL